jgi:hypothetical protein
LHAGKQFTFLQSLRQLKVKVALAIPLLVQVFLLLMTSGPGRRPRTHEWAAATAA